MNQWVAAAVLLVRWEAIETVDKSAVLSDDDDEPWWMDQVSEKEVVEPKGLVDWVREGLVWVVTDELVSHPEIRTLSLHLPAATHESVSIRSVDKNLLVLYICRGSSGNYMVYAAAADALFVAPPTDSFGLGEMFGRRPIVMRRGEGSGGDFVLSLLLLSYRTGQYSLFLWSPSSALGGEGQQWLCKEVCLPKDVVEFEFMVDVAFAFHGRWACWVDLHLGILTCDLLLPDPQFQFKLLPDDYVLGTSVHRGHPDAYSTVGCVDGKVKFLYIHGYDVGRDGEVPDDKITINNWTLVGRFPDQCTWMKDHHATLSLGDLWADESFLASPGLPKGVPSIPVLSPKEPDVVFFFLNDLCYVDGRATTTTKGQYALSLNMQSKKVQSWIDCSHARLQLCPSFVTADLFGSVLTRNQSNLDEQVTSSQTMIPETNFDMSCNAFLA